MSDAKCPICGGFDEKNHFTCPNCGRENICEQHHDVDYLICSDCADKERQRELKKQAVKKKKVVIKKDPDVVVQAPEEIKSPFNFKKVNCPICDTVSNQRMFKTKLYSEKKVDVDKHVLEFGWSDSDFKMYHPPLYYLWHCPNCRFTESYLEFENPGKPVWSHFKELKEFLPNHLADEPNARKLVNWLGKNIDFNQMTHLLAIRLHLLAIYFQELLDMRAEVAETEDTQAEEDEEEPEAAGEDLRDPLKLARFYLRLGWLYRELREAAESELKAESEAKSSSEQGGKPEKSKREEYITAKNILKELAKVWDDVPPSESAIFLRAAQFMTKSYEVHPAIKNVAAAADMLLWIAGVYITIGQEKKGVETLNSVLSSGQKSKTKLEMRLKNGKLTSEDERQVNKYLVSVDRTISRARDLIADLQFKKTQAIKTKAKQIIAQMQGQEPEVIRAKLAKEGIKSSIIEALVPLKKKKLFGLF